MRAPCFMYDGGGGRPHEGAAGGRSRGPLSCLIQSAQPAVYLSRKHSTSGSIANPMAGEGESPAAVLNPEPEPLVQLLAKDQMKKTAMSNGVDWEGHVTRMGAVAEVVVVVVGGGELDIGNTGTIAEVREAELEMGGRISCLPFSSPFQGEEREGGHDGGGGNVSHRIKGRAVGETAVHMYDVSTPPYCGLCSWRSSRPSCRPAIWTCPITDYEFSPSSWRSSRPSWSARTSCTPTIT